jgi:hypothetical protein
MDDAAKIKAFWALAAVMIVATVARVSVVVTCTYILHPDETFQYFEQAHRIVFGAGVVPWEYHDGIRSWLLPGVIAGLMRVTALFSDNPRSYILAARLASIALSLAVPYVAYRVAERDFGQGSAVVVGLLCALWYDAVYFAPVVMTEEQATHLALLALWFSQPRAGSATTDRHRAALAGALLGLAVCLRFQYGPPLAGAMLWQLRRDRPGLLVVAVSAFAVVAVGSGLLDLITWDAPFQSIWLNLERNTLNGVSSAISREPWFYMPAYFIVDGGILLPVFIGLWFLGARRFPALAIAAISTVVLHTLMPHKELRFIYLAIAVTPILIGLGVAELLSWPILRHRHGVTAGACVVVVLTAGMQCLVATSGALPPESLRIDRSTSDAFLAAHEVPELCGLGVRALSVYWTGGYTYLHRDVPIYYETFERAQHVEDFDFRFTLSVIQQGKEVSQHPDNEFAAASMFFNVMIAPNGEQLPGFSSIGCYGTDSRYHVEVCLFRRPGECRT